VEKRRKNCLLCPWARYLTGWHYQVANQVVNRWQLDLKTAKVMHFAVFWPKTWLIILQTAIHTKFKLVLNWIIFLFNFCR